MLTLLITFILTMISCNFIIVQSCKAQEAWIQSEWLNLHLFEINGSKCNGRKVSGCLVKNYVPRAFEHGNVTLEFYQQIEGFQHYQDFFLLNFTSISPNALGLGGCL